MSTTVAPMTPSAAPLWRNPTWRVALGAVALLLAFVIWTYRDTAVSMVTIWSRSDTFAHAFLVPPISLWLIWRQREALARMQPRPEPWVLLPMAVLAFGWLLGDLVSINALTQFMLTGLIVLAVPALLGMQVTRQILFPLGFLFFSVPFGEFTQPKMMEWTADFTVWALQLSGVPVYREGLQFVIPTGRWSVVEACSGVRYLIASFMVGTLFAYLNYRTMWRRWVFVGIAILVPIIANWLRAYGIVMLGHLSSNELGVGVDHLIYGWLFFGVVILIMFSIGARWSEPDDPVPGTAAVPSGGSEFPAAAGRPARSATAAWATMAAAAGLMLLPHAALNVVERADSTLAPTLELPALASKGWVAVGAEPQLEPTFVNPSLKLHQTYRHASHGQVHLYVAYYRKQDYERKLVSSTHKLAPATGTSWHPVSRSPSTVAMGDTRVDFAAEVFSPLVASTVDSPKILALQSFWLDGRWTASQAKAKLYGAFQRLLGRGDDGAALVVYAEGADPRALAGQLEAFLRDAGGPLQAALQATRDRR